ncbi:hypothetical protein ACHQM5_015142 [Ranunculus cassubicifolius]
MPEGSHSLIPHVEPEVGPFAYYTHEIEGLFSQKEDRNLSLSSKPVTFAGTLANVKDDDIGDGDCKGTEIPSTSFARKLFCNGVGDGLSAFKEERLKASLKQSVTAFGQETEETLQSVLYVMKMKKQLYIKERVTKSESPSSTDFESNKSPHKKRKISSSRSPRSDVIQSQPLGTLSWEEASSSEGIDSKEPNFDSSDKRQRKRSCVYCKATSTPQWRPGPDGQKNLCNACGLRFRKKKLFLPEFDEVEESTEVDKGLRSLLGIDESIPKETLVKYADELVEKYSDELHAKMENMEQQLEKYLGVIMSNCRKMTIEEKLNLRQLIQNLPQKNLDQVVEIILQTRKLPEGHSCNILHIDLENEDNVTLWRLYYYVKAVERACHLAAMESRK